MVILSVLAKQGPDARLLLSRRWVFFWPKIVTTNIQIPMPMQTAAIRFPTVRPFQAPGVLVEGIIGRSEVQISGSPQMIPTHHGYTDSWR